MLVPFSDLEELRLAIPKTQYYFPELVRDFRTLYQSILECFESMELNPDPEAGHFFEIRGDDLFCGGSISVKYSRGKGCSIRWVGDVDMALLDRVVKLPGYPYEEIVSHCLVAKKYYPPSPLFAFMRVFVQQAPVLLFQLEYLMDNPPTLFATEVLSECLSTNELSKNLLRYRMSEV